MMDFSTLKGLTIPEGEVKQITDANGNVQWSAVKNVTITITSDCNGIDGDTSEFTINSTAPFAPDPSNPSYTTTTWHVMCYDMPDCTIEIPVGSTIDCTVTDSKQSNRCYVMVNGVEVLGEPGTYTYAVTRDASVYITDRYDMGEYGMITITE